MHTTKKTNVPHSKQSHLDTYIDTFKPLFSTSSNHEVASCNRIFPKPTGRPLPHRNVPSVAHVQLLYDATASSYVSRIAPGEFSRSKTQTPSSTKKSLGSHGINLTVFRTGRFYASKLWQAHMILTFNSGDLPAPRLGDKVYGANISSIEGG